MPERTYANDLIQVLRGLQEPILSAIRDGKKTHPPGDWLKHSMEDHLRHAVGHINDVLNQKLKDEELQTALSHLICRAIMAWQMREKSKTAMV